VGGLLLALGYPAVVENIGLDKLELKMGLLFRGVQQDAGGLVVANNNGTLFNDHVTGTMTVNAEKSDSSSLVGGLVAYNEGMIVDTYATTRISSKGASTGGLVGFSYLEIANSFATGNISSKNGPYNGGLVGANEGLIKNSYALGSVTGTGTSDVGGFLGLSSSSQNLPAAYSIGHVTAQQGLVGGFLGTADGPVGTGDSGGSGWTCYWDTTTSGTNEGTGDGNAPGITGLTTKQLKSGLPTGFDPSIWAQDKKINNGFPYLIATPPPE
jgi:hypothetical protein